MTTYRRYHHDTKNLEKVNLLSTRLQCVRVCVNFPHAKSFADFLRFSFISFINTRKEQTIINSIYLFSVVLNVSNVFHRK